MELVVACSSVDTGIRCWDIVYGVEQFRHRYCASPPHGLRAVSTRFLASSQLSENPSSSSAPIFFWSWEKPQVRVKSFPAEPIGPLVSDSDGFYIIGGGSSGAIYIWEVASGKLLTKWTAHYRSVTCLTLSDDESLLISGSEDGSVRVWPLVMVFDDTIKESGENLYTYSFSKHALRVTSVISGHGLCKSFIISSSEDRTCKVWSLSQGRLLRSITFPFIINAIAMDPAEHIFYAGCQDGKIYVAALSVEWNPVRNHGNFIIDSLFDNSKAITCLAFSTDGVTLVSGSEDGAVRVWNTKTGQMTRLLKHAKAPVSNILIVKKPIIISQLPYSEEDKQLLMGRPLQKYIDPNVESIAVIIPHQNSNNDLEEWQLENRDYVEGVMRRQIKELQQNASSGAVQMELERLRAEWKRSTQIGQQWKKLYNDLQTTIVNELGVGVDSS